MVVRNKYCPGVLGEAGAFFPTNGSNVHTRMEPNNLHNTKASSKSHNTASSKNNTKASSKNHTKAISPKMAPKSDPKSDQKVTKKWPSDQK